MSNPQKENNRQILREKVVCLVKDFVKTEGGITIYDLNILFGIPDNLGCPQVASILAEGEIIFK